jgi:hypothetical protein
MLGIFIYITNNKCQMIFKTTCNCNNMRRIFHYSYSSIIIRMIHIFIVVHFDFTLSRKELKEEDIMKKVSSMTDIPSHLKLDLL